MVRHSQLTSESWKNLPWKKFRRDLFRLQRRLFKAVQAGDKRKARSLQKLILKSKAARMLAIRQVSQLNAVKKAEVRRQKAEGIPTHKCEGFDKLATHLFPSILKSRGCLTVWQSTEDLL